jgi:hypothetical protein
MLSESSWRSIENTEIGKSATKAIIMLLSGKFFTKKVVDGGGDLKCCDPESFLAPPVFCSPPLTRHPGYASESVIYMMVWKARQTSKPQNRSCVLDLHSITQVVSRLHATILGKSCEVLTGLKN